MHFSISTRSFPNLFTSGRATEAAKGKLKPRNAPLRSCAKLEDFRSVSRTEEKAPSELFREKQILFPARISCVTLTCSQIKPLAPQLKDADPPVPLLQSAGGIVSPTVVSSTVFYRMKGWLLTPSQGRDSQLCVRQDWYGQEQCCLWRRSCLGMDKIHPRLALGCCGDEGGGRGRESLCVPETGD